MMSLKQFSVSLVAVAAAVAASAASAAVTQPVTATTATIDFDTAFLTANNITVSALGSATVNSSTGVGTLSVASTSLASSATGSLTVTFASGAGIALTANGVTVNITNFYFDNTNDTLYADLSAYGGFVSKSNLGLLTAGSVTGSFGSSSLDAVASSTTTRTLNMLASNFSLGADVVSLLGANASAFAYVASTVKDIKIGTVSSSTVPEPSTYALMGLGLVGMAFLRRKQQA